MDANFIDNYLNQKIIENKDFIRITFYELRVKYNLSENDTNGLLHLIRTKLKRLEYKTYSTGNKYTYNGIEKIVEQNELMIAIKED